MNCAPDRVHDEGSRQKESVITGVNACHTTRPVASRKSGQQKTRPALGKPGLSMIFREQS
jgi:hypothetical protein